MFEDVCTSGAPIPSSLTICTATGGHSASATVCPCPGTQVLEANAEVINNTTAFPSPPLSASPHSVNRHMARPRTPKPARTDSCQGHDNQRGPLGAPEWLPRAVYDQPNKPPTETRCELEHNEILMKAWDQVRSGDNHNGETDRRTRQSPSFSPIGNSGRAVHSRSVSYPLAYTMATTPQHLIYARSVSIQQASEHLLNNLKSGEIPIQSPCFVSRH